MPLSEPGAITHMYKSQQLGLNQLEGAVLSLCRNLLTNKNLKIHLITSRVKSLDSTIEKFIRKNKYDTIDDVTDMVGVRIITLFESTVDDVAKVIESEFQIDYQNSIDKRKSIDPDKFGYLSLHYVASLTEDRLKLSEYRDLPKCKFEIQIRSMLQHAWAEIEHDLGYKKENEVPREIRRAFSQTASMLEVSDSKFNEVNQKTKDYLNTSQNKIERNEFDLPIDTITLNRLSHSETIKRVELAIADLSESNLLEKEAEIDIDVIHKAGFSKISEIIDFYNQFHDDIINFYRGIASVAKRSAKYSGFSINGAAYLKMIKENLYYSYVFDELKERPEEKLRSFLRLSKTLFEFSGLKWDPSQELEDFINKNGIVI